MPDEPSLDPASQRPFYRLLGLRAEVQATAGTSKIVLESRPELENSRGDVHGGAIAGMLDAAIGVAVRSACAAGTEAATISLTVNYAAPGRGTLVARGRAIRVGKSVATAEANVVDAGENVVAHAIATMRIIAPRP